MSLEPPQKVRKLRTALHAKAKGSPSYRFYLLYDKVYREDILAFAYRCCKANGGAAGVDGQRFADIEAYGVQRWLSELAETPAWTGPPGLSGRGRPRPVPASPVAAAQAQGPGSGLRTLPR